MPVIIANTFLCTIIWDRYLGIQPRNVLGVTSTGDKVHVGTVMAANWTTNMMDCILSGRTVSGISVLPLDGSSASYQAPISPPLGGSQTSGTENPAQAVVISLKTALRGSAHRGRVYMGPVAARSATEGALHTGNASTMTTAWNGFITALAAASPPIVLVVVSRKHLSTNVVGSLVVELPLGTQRRRQSQLR